MLLWLMSKSASPPILIFELFSFEIIDVSFIDLFLLEPTLEMEVPMKSDKKC